MTLGLVTFLLSVIGTWVGMHYYVFLNLHAAGVPRTLLVTLLWALALSFPVTRLLSFKWRNPLLRFFYWIGATWMGLIFMLTFWFMVTSVIRHGFTWTGFANLANPAPWIIGTASVVALMGVGGIAKAFSGPKVVEFTVDRSARYGKGVRRKLVQVSDIHLGLILGKTYLESLVGKINALSPDLVFITGDLFDPEFASDDAAAKLLGSIKAADGVYAVSGNHEFYSGMDRFLEMMKNAGIPVLNNETMITKSGVQISGIHDQTANRFPGAGVTCELDKALHAIDPASPSVLLAHQPKELEPAVAKRVDLILSGHTHAGQVFPFRAVVRLAYKYLGGIYRLGPDSELIVCTGTGFWGPPLRVGTDSQIVVVDFRY